MWKRVFQTDRPGPAWYLEGQAVSPQHDWGRAGSSPVGLAPSGRT